MDSNLEIAEYNKFGSNPLKTLYQSFCLYLGNNWEEMQSSFYSLLFREIVLIFL